jgi:hypothetical protein
MNDDNVDRLLLSDMGLIDVTTSSHQRTDEEEVVSLHTSHILRDDGGRAHQEPHQDHPFKWRIADQDVSHVPEIYPSLCCPLLIEDLSVRVIGERVSDFMRLNSIRCEYDNEKARASCTASCVSFVIQLWKANPRQSGKIGMGTINSDNNGILVEVRRRQGCSIGMHRIRHALVRSIQSENGQPVRLDMTSFLRRRFTPSPRVKELFKSNSFKSHDKSPLSLYNKEDLRNTIDLLESDSYHENDLGIESLCFLSDPTNARKEEAVEVACALIFRRGEHGGDVQNAVEDYLYDLKERRAIAYQRQYFHALSAMANSMALILDEIDEQTLIRWREDGSLIMLKVFWRNVMEVVVKQLSSFRESPSCAAVAARCIRLAGLLAPKGEGDLLCVDFSQLPYLLHSAHEYGMAYNAMLEEESFNLSSVVANMHQ